MNSLDETAEYLARLKWILDEPAARREIELRVQAVEEAEQRSRQIEKEKIARRLLAIGSEIETIVTATELDEERISKIQKDMHQ